MKYILSKEYEFEGQKYTEIEIESRRAHRQGRVCRKARVDPRREHSRR